MTYGYLALAIVFEVAWALGVKLSVGFTKPVPAAITIVCYVLSLVFLTLAARTLDIGVAYAIWAGLGIALIAGVGIVWLNEPASAIKLGSIALIILGVVGLHLSGGHAATP